MRYVKRDASGKVVAHFANEQTYAKEAVADDHPDILKYYADIKEGMASARAEAAANDPVKLLEKKVEQLEAIIAKLKV